MRIAVVAPSCSLHPGSAEAVRAIAAGRGESELVIHPQRVASPGHVAAADIQRRGALREAMAGPSADAVRWARGGYGSSRIAEAGARDGRAAARGKHYLGYCDAAF